jgi:sodium-dependent dicarboxylate transporter 2/3/5
MSTPAAANPPVTSSPGLATGKWIWLAVAIVVGLVLAFSPTPQGLTRTGQLVLAITAGTVILWATEVMNNGVASVLMMALLIAVKVPPPRALSGFADPAFWTLLAVLYYGFAMRKTGLAERLSYYILTLFPGTYAGILSAFFVIGFVLALGIPSMTVRTAIMAPIAWAMVQTLGLAPRSKGSALIMLTVVEMAVVPGLAFELGSLNGPVVLKMFADKHLPITWTGYAQVMTVPTLIFCGLILGLNMLLLRPEAPLRASTDFARTKLAALGSIKRPEMITALVVGISIFLWATNGKLHSLPTFAVGMFAMGVFALSGILQDADIATGVSWTLLLFLGGIFGLGNVIVDTKITDWMAGLMLPHVGSLISSPMLLLIVVLFAMLALRFLDPTAFIAMPLIFLPLQEPLAKAGIPPLVLTAPLLLASAPFWMTYMNFWIAMGDSITQKQAFSKMQLFNVANIYAVSAIMALVAGVFYWRMIGIF